MAVPKQNLTSYEVFAGHGGSNRKVADVMFARVYFAIDRAPRRELKTAGTVRRDGYPETVWIDNLSISGVHITTDLEIDVDDIVTMGIPGIGTHLARVVRKSETGYGCAFLRSIAESDVARADADTIVPHERAVAVQSPAEPIARNAGAMSRKWYIVAAAGAILVALGAMLIVLVQGA